MLQSGTMMMIVHTWIRYESGSFLCSKATRCILIPLFAELWRTVIGKPSGFGGSHCSGSCLATSLKLACAMFALEMGEKVLSVHHSLKRWSVLYKLYFVFLFICLCIVFSVILVFTGRFIRKCKTLMAAVIFYKCRVKTVACEKLCYEIGFQSRYSVLQHSWNHHEHSVVQYSTSCHILIMVSNCTLC